MGVRSKIQNRNMQVLLIASMVAAATAFPQYAAPLVVAAAEDLSEPPVYAFNYGVADDYSGAAFSQSEQRDGYATSGSYTVNLPDGRIQTVNYVDNGDGITQDVSYPGTPSYGPAPVAVAHAAPVLTHAVHAAPLLSHAPVLSHAVHASPFLAHGGVAVAHAAPVLSHAVAHPALGHIIG